MDTVYAPSKRSSLITECRTGASRSRRNITHGVDNRNRHAYQQPFRTQRTIVQTSQAAIIADPAPFSIPIRYSAYNLNSNTEALKFVPRSGSLMRIVDSEEGEGGSYSFEQSLPTEPVMKVRDRNVFAQPPIEKMRQEQLPTPPPSSPDSSTESLASTGTTSTESGSPVNGETEEAIPSYPPPPPGLPPGGASATESKSFLVPSKNPFLDDAAYTGAVLSELVYSSPESTQRRDDPDLSAAGFKYQSGLSTAETAVYDLPQANTRFIALRGTATKKDIGTDIALALGQIKRTNRYQQEKKRVENIIDDALRRDPSTQIRIAGHSLGGTLTTSIVEDIIKERPSLVNQVGGYAYNEGSTPFSKKCQGIGCTQTQHYRTEYDIISWFKKKDQKTLKGCSRNPLKAHSTSNITNPVCLRN